jgi:hypothetical protein
MTKEAREALRIHFKWTVLEYSRGIGNVTKACRELEVPRSTFYEWKKVFNKKGNQCIELNLKMMQPCFT